MNVSPICVASVSHHTHCINIMGNLVPGYVHYHVFPCWQKQKIAEKSASPHRFWSRPMTRNRRLLLALYILDCFIVWVCLPDFLSWFLIVHSCGFSLNRRLSCTNSTNACPIMNLNDHIHAAKSSCEFKCCLNWLLIFRNLLGKPILRFCLPNSSN